MTMCRRQRIVIVELIVWASIWPAIASLSTWQCAALHLNAQFSPFLLTSFFSPPPPSRLFRHQAPRDVVGQLPDGRTVAFPELQRKDAVHPCVEHGDAGAPAQPGVAAVL